MKHQGQQFIYLFYLFISPHTRKIQDKKEGRQIQYTSMQYLRQKRGKKTETKKLRDYINNIIYMNLLDLMNDITVIAWTLQT